MADADTVLIINVHTIIGGQCKWTKIGEYLHIPFYVAQCGGSGAIPTIVSTFEYCPWCGLEIKL